MMTEWRTLLQKVGGGGKRTKMITLPSALTQFISLFSLGPLALFTLLFRLSAATAVMALNSDSEHTYKTTTDKQFGKKRELSLSSFSFFLSALPVPFQSVLFDSRLVGEISFLEEREKKGKKKKPTRTDVIQPALQHTPARDVVPLFIPFCLFVVLLSTTTVCYNYTCRLNTSPTRDFQIF